MRRRPDFQHADAANGEGRSQQPPVVIVDACAFFHGLMTLFSPQPAKPAALRFQRVALRFTIFGAACPASCLRSVVGLSSDGSVTDAGACAGAEVGRISGRLFFTV